VRTLAFFSFFLIFSTLLFAQEGIRCFDLHVESVSLPKVKWSYTLQWKQGEEYLVSNLSLPEGHEFTESKVLGQDAWNKNGYSFYRYHCESSWEGKKIPSSVQLQAVDAASKKYTCLLEFNVFGRFLKKKSSFSWWLPLGGAGGLLFIAFAFWRWKKRVLIKEEEQEEGSVKELRDFLLQKKWDKFFDMLAKIDVENLGDVDEAYLKDIESKYRYGSLEPDERFIAKIDRELRKKSNSSFNDKEAKEQALLDKVLEDES
jgi:hypothetical protein